MSTISETGAASALRAVAPPRNGATGWALLNRNGERYLLLVFYAMIVVTISTEVLRRFLLSYSSPWGEEVARYCFIYLAWIGASAAVRERAHIRIDVLFHFVGPRLRATLYLFGDVVTLALAVVVFAWSIFPILTSLEYGSVTEGLRISKAWFLAAIPLGFGMMVIRLCQSIHRDIADIRAGRPVFEGSRLFD